MSDDTTPIEVNGTPEIDQIWTGVRQLAPAVLAFALGRGWVPQDAVPMITALGLMVWPIIAAQIKTRERSKNLATLAAIAPDSIAVVK